jgi:hypothetical protein
VLSIAMLAAACGSAPSTEPATKPTGTMPATGAGPKVHFEYVTISGQLLSTQTLAGRISVIGFVTTYDYASQAQARFLSVLLRRHTPRLNVALLVLEPAENQILVETYVKSLRLSYPVALSDAATIAGHGPFTGLHHVPSVVILDAEGREAWRHIGLIDEAGLEQAVRAVEGLDRSR